MLFRSLMRIIYSALFYLAIPFIFLRLLWRSIKAPAYRKRWLERLAIYTHTYPEHVLWFHSVSVGETEALFPLIKQLQIQKPTAKILITTTTPTGSSRVHALFKDTVTHVYLPYDAPDIVQRFIRTFKPQIAVFMETEIWPNSYHYCQQQHIKLYIINARLSERSKRGYQFLSSLIQPALASAHIISQSKQDTNRFFAIGAHPDLVTTLGNMQFDLEVSNSFIEQGKKLRETYFNNRFVWLIASTHQGEEDILLSCYLTLKKSIPTLLLLIAPRHPERFAAVKHLCHQQQLSVLSRTTHQPTNSTTDVYLIDTLGELKLFYSTADVAFIGGSLVPVGGHNLLEAAAVGTPILFGPFMTNFKDIAANILAVNGAVQCTNSKEITQTLINLYQNPDARNTLANNAISFLQTNKGVTHKICEILLSAISATPENSSHSYYNL